MNFSSNQSKKLTWAGVLLFNLILGWFAFWAFDAKIIELDFYAVSTKLRYLRGGLLFLLAGNAILLGTVLFEKHYWLMNISDQLIKVFARLKWGNLLILAGLFAGFEWLVFDSYYGLFVAPMFTRLWVFWLTIGLGAVFLSAWRGAVRLPWQLSVLVVGVVMAAGHQALAYLPGITDYPLALGWSETSRYYQASFYFSERIYGMKLPLPITHPSRYLLQAVPFLFPNLSLAAHRGWQVLLTIGLPLLTGWTLARRLKIEKVWLTVLFVLWSFLFLIIGPVYYHLTICVLIVLWGFDKDRLGWSLLVVTIASVWAGISRINWVPVPGMVAACLMYLEVPVSEKTWLPWKYFLKSLSYFIVGSIVAFGAYTAYIAISGNAQVEQFASAFTSALLWNRLWPNPSYRLGIVPGIVLASAPLWLLTGWFVRRNWQGWHYLRLLGLVAVMLVLFVGGLVVSTKIGGGTNLHNMDAYMVILWLFGGYVFFNQVTSEPERAFLDVGVPNWLLGVLVLVPVWFSAQVGGPQEPLNFAVANEIIDQIDEFTADVLAQGGEALFIYERQLLIFDLLEHEPELIHDYERLFLMEMAISHNEPYLTNFYKNLDERRFGMILTGPLDNRLKLEGEESIAAEHNDWVIYVGRPIRCAYESAYRNVEYEIEILVPRLTNVCEINPFYENTDH